MCGATSDVCYGPKADLCDAIKEVRFGLTAGSSLRSDLGSERLRDYFPVPYNKCVRSELVRIVRCFGRPNNIAVIAVNRSMPHRERGARFCKLRDKGRKEGLDRGWTP